MLRALCDAAALPPLMPSPEPSSASSPRRRATIAGIGAAIIGTILWWRRDPGQPSEAAAPASSAATAPVKHATVTPEETATSVVESGAPFSRNWFVPHLNTEFTMNSEAFAAESVTLVSIGEARPETDRDHHVNYTSFSLLFKGSAGMPRASGIVHMNHAALGKFDVFLSSVGHHKDRVMFEAVFSQRV